MTSGQPPRRLNAATTCRPTQPTSKQQATGSTAPARPLADSSVAIPQCHVQTLTHSAATVADFKWRDLWRIPGCRELGTRRPPSTVRGAAVLPASWQFHPPHPTRHLTASGAPPSGAQAVYVRTYGNRAGAYSSALAAGRQLAISGKTRATHNNWRMPRQYALSNQNDHVLVRRSPAIGAPPDRLGRSGGGHTSASRAPRHLSLTGAKGVGISGLSW